MAHQLTIQRLDNSFVKAFFISNSLYQMLVTISHIFESNSINLDVLLKIKAKALSTCSLKIKSQEPIIVLAFATVSLDWFDELLALIAAVEKLQEPHTLSICFN